MEDAVSPEAQRPERTMLSQGKRQYSGSIWLSKPAAHPLTYSQWKKFPSFEHWFDFLKQPESLGAKSCEQIAPLRWVFLS